jgi:uncharacterized metal-binding protein
MAQHDTKGGADGGGSGRQVMFYACSGGANVAEVADRAARELMFEGRGVMFCLAGLGAGMEAMIHAAREVDLNVVIDGCPLDCAKRIFDNCGVDNYVQVKVTDLGIDKAKGVRATREQVAAVIARVKEALAEA